MARALLSLGSNLGDRASYLRDALARLDQSTDIQLARSSSWWATAPAGGPAGQGEFLNGAAIVETTLSPLALLDQLQRIEQAGGRERTTHWSARTIDLDLLLYGDTICSVPRLELPHPRLAFRRFVLDPAAEIAGDWRHPRIDWTLHELARHARESPLYLAVIGNDPQLVRSLIQQLLAREPGQWLPNPHDNSAEESGEIFAPRKGPESCERHPVDSRERVASIREQWRIAAAAPRDWLRVSDFWWDVANDAEALEPAPLQPVLRVWIEGPARIAEPSSDSQSDGTRQVEASKWREAIMRPRRGPWLMLEGASPERCLDELRGAVAALRDAAT